MKLISAHDVSVFRDVLQNIGQTSGRILLEIESEVPLSKKKRKRKKVNTFLLSYTLLIISLSTFKLPF